jgi:hypothetical protein
MEAMRQSWTDERLDDLNARVDDLGRRMDAGFARVDAELRDLSRHFDAKFDGLTRTLLQVGAALCAGMLGVFAAMIGLIATQI